VKQSLKPLFRFESVENHPNILANVLISVKSTNYVCEYYVKGLRTLLTYGQAGD
jgi:hypothetical protein